jgi:drug/metabolite transporter (DMT)-like permease
MSKNTHDGDSGAGLALVALSAASFGLSGALARGLLTIGWTPGAVVLVRLGLGALVVAPFAFADLRGRWRVVRAHAGLVALYGVVPMALAQFAYFSAVGRMAVGPALLIEFTAPAAVIAWLWLRRGERPSTMTLGGAAVCLVGLVLVLDLVAGPSLNPIGVGWALLAMVGAASYFLLGSDGISEVPAVGLAGCGLVAATASLGLLGAIGVMPLGASSASPQYAGVHVVWWLPLLALGAITCGLAYCAGVAGIRRLGSRVASFVGLLEVVSGVVWAWALLSQVPGPLQLVGGLLLLAGIVVVRLGEGRPAPGSGDLRAGGGATGAPQRLAIAAGEPSHRALPGALARGRQAGAAQPLSEDAAPDRSGHRHERAGQGVGVGRGEQPTLPVLDE